MASNEKDAELDIEIGVNWKSNMMKSGLRLVYDDGVELLVIDKSSQGEEDRRDRMADVEKICVVGEKHKKSAWKPPKPPRPPNGPSILDAADRKLVRELAELATRKRARFERIRALKKMKATKPSSGNNGSVSAMFIMVIFFLVIAFQGNASPSSIA